MTSGACPACSSTRIKTTDSRPLADGRARRRRYRCLDCDHRTTTLEVVVEANNERVSHQQIEDFLKGT